MIRLSASDVAITGFGVVARRPAVLAWWIGFHLLFMGALSALFVVFAGPVLTQIMALQAQNTPNDPETQAQMLALFRHVLPLYAIMFPVMLVFYAVLFATMNRVMLRPAQSAFGYLRLGMDEWRQFLLFLWALVVAIGAYIAVIVIAIVFGIIGVAIFGLMHKGGAAPGDTNGAITLGAIVFGLLYLAAYVYALVRLSLSSAMTFDTGRVSFFRSWRLTKGRFWPMFSAYLLAVILSIVVSLLGLIVMLVCTMLAGGVGGLAFMVRPDMSSPAAYFTLPRLIYFALGGLLYALVWPILLTPSAAIYKALTATSASTPASWPTPPPPSEPPPPAPVAAPPGDPAPL